MLFGHQEPFKKQRRLDASNDYVEKKQYSQLYPSDLFFNLHVYLFQI